MLSRREIMVKFFQGNSIKATHIVLIQIICYLAVACFYVTLVLQVIWSFTAVTSNGELTDQERLLEKIFGSNRRMSEIIPKKNLTDNIPLIVHFNFIVSHVFEIRSDEEEVDLSLWISFRWVNQLVNWNLTEFPVKYLDISVSKIWVPKLYLIQNTIQSDLHPPAFGSKTTIYPDGFTTLDFGTKVKVRCKMPSCIFPMDEHHCKLRFVSNSHDISDLVVLPNSRIQKQYEHYSINETGLWHIFVGNFTTTTVENYLFRGNASSSAVINSIKLVRKSRYFWITVVFPVSVTFSITLFAPLFPLETGERSSILITCFLATIVYLDSVFKTIPKTSDDLPLLVLFLLVSLSFTVFQILITAFIAYFDNKTHNNKSLLGLCYFALVKKLGIGKSKAQKRFPGSKKANWNKGDATVIENRPESEDKDPLKKETISLESKELRIRSISQNKGQTKTEELDMEITRPYSRSSVREEGTSCGNKSNNFFTKQKILESVLFLSTIVVVSALIFTAVWGYSGKIADHCKD